METKLNISEKTAIKLANAFEKSRIAFKNSSNDMDKLFKSMIENIYYIEYNKLLSFRFKESKALIFTKWYYKKKSDKQQIMVNDLKKEINKAQLEIENIIN